MEANKSMDNVLKDAGIRWDESDFWQHHPIHRTPTNVGSILNAENDNIHIFRIIF